MILVRQIKERPSFRAHWGYKRNDAVRNAGVLCASEGCAQRNCHVAEFSRRQIFQMFGICVRKRDEFTGAVGNLKNCLLARYSHLPSSKEIKWDAGTPDQFGQSVVSGLGCDPNIRTKSSREIDNRES